MLYSPIGSYNVFVVDLVWHIICFATSNWLIQSLTARSWMHISTVSRRRVASCFDWSLIVSYLTLHALCCQCQFYRQRISSYCSRLRRPIHTAADIYLCKYFFRCKFVVSFFIMFVPAQGPIYLSMFAWYILRIFASNVSVNASQSSSVERCYYYCVFCAQSQTLSTAI